MFGPVPVGGVTFSAAALGQQAVDCRELGRFCESEAGGSSEPEPMAPARPRGGSGNKRSRAAEVHNLSEKRRRSRINEKMKALQNLIPNSNKTDKASMLDEVIEYLKQLQLQVQGGKPHVADFVHGSDGLGNISIPDPTIKKVEQSAAEFLVDKVSEFPGEVSVLALGPLTNVALAIKMDPSIVSKVKRIVVLGGAFFAAGNATPSAEANLFEWW